MCATARHLEEGVLADFLLHRLPFYCNAVIYFNFIGRPYQDLDTIQLQ